MKINIKNDKEKTKIEKTLKPENKNSLYNKIFTVLIIVTMILGIFFRIWGLLNKVNLHMDEAYSYGLTHYKNIQIADNEDIFFTKHDGKYFKDYLSLSKNELGDIKSIYINQANDVHPPLYYVFLRIASLFTLNDFSIYTGVALNILIYILSSFMIIKITKKIFGLEEDEIEVEVRENELKQKNIVNKKIYLPIALSVLLFYSVSRVSVNQVLFARMYEFTNLMILIFMSTYIDVLKIDENGIKEGGLSKESKENKSKYIKLGIVTILGALTHYYFAFMVIIIYLISIFFLLKSNKKKLLKNITKTFLLSGLIYIILWPWAFLHIVDNGRSNKTKYAEKVKEFMKRLDFNILILPIIVLFSELTNRVNKSKSITQIKGNTEFKLNKLEEKSNLKQRNKDTKSILYIFFFGSLTFLLIIFKIAIFILDRYIYLALLIFIMSSMYIIYLNSNKKYLRVSLIAFILLYIIIGTNTFIMLKNKDLEFQYYNEKEFFNKVEEVKDIPLLYLYTDDEYYNLTDDIYLLSKFKSVTIAPNNMSKNAKAKAIDILKDISKIKRKNERIFINPNFKNEYDKYLENGKNLILLKDENLIKDKDYKIKKIGEIRERKLYILEK